MRRLTLPLVVLLSACGSLGFEAEITDRAPFRPPEIYLEWWANTMACSNRTGSFESLAFYLATSITGDGLVARARWSAPHDIVIVRGYETDSKTVRHEMLHDLLRGDREHTDSLWDSCDLLFG